MDQQAIPDASVSIRVLVQTPSYENEFDLHDNETSRTHFHMNVSQEDSF